MPGHHCLLSARPSPAAQLGAHTSQQRADRPAPWLEPGKQYPPAPSPWAGAHFPGLVAEAQLTPESCLCTVGLGRPGSQLCGATLTIDHTLRRRSSRC